MSDNIIRLNNGVRIHINDCHTTDVVCLNVLIKAGSKNEQSHENGISHFLEHMAFKGTKNRTAKQIAEEFENAGGYINAYTSREHTSYTAKILKKDFALAVDILSDILLNSQFKEDELEKERNVIIQEIDMNNDTPEDIVFDNFYLRAFCNQAFGSYILGTKDKIKSYSREDLIKYMQREYSSDKIIVTASGNISDDTSRKILTEAFEKFKKSPSVNTPEIFFTEGELYEDKKIEQLHFIMGFEGLKISDEKIYTLRLLSLILGGGMSSRLFQEVRENHALAYHVGSYNYNYKETGTFSLYASTSPDQAVKLTDIICTELKKMCSDVTSEELNRAKNQYKASLLMGDESSETRAARAAYQISCFNKIITNEEIVSNVDCVTIDNIQDLMENILSSSKIATSAVGNLKHIESYNKIKSKLL